MSKYVGKIVTNQAPAGYSVYFDGTGDWVSVADSTAFTLGSGNFTIEFWVYSTLAAQRQFIAGQMASSGANSSASFTIEKTAGNKLLCGYYSAALQYGATSSADIPLNTWAHIAFVRDGNTLRQYINGVQDGSVSVTGVTANDSSSQLAIGRAGEFASTFYFGYVSNFRFVNGTCLYPSGTSFTPPTQLLNVTNTSLLTCNSPAIVDQSSNAFAITTNGNAAVSTFTPFVAYNPYNPALGASTPGVWTLDEAMQAAATRQWNMYDPSFQNTTLLLHGNGTNGAQNNTFLDSSSNNFTITRNGNTTQGSYSPFSQTGWSNFFDGAASSFYYRASATPLVLSGGSWTIEAWVFLTGGSSYRTVISKRTGATAEYEMGVDPSGNFYYYTSTVYSSSTAVPQNQWVHLAVSYDGTNLRLFQNGIVTRTEAGVTAGSGTGNLGIAAEGSGGTQTFPGYISNARITKGGALYTSNFTPSTVPLTTTVSAGTVSLLICQSNRFLDNSANNYTFIFASNTPSVQAFSPFYPTAAYTPQTIGGSGYFDGSGDFLSFPTNSVLVLGSGNFTAEAWIYPTAAVSSTQMIAGSWDGTATLSWTLLVTATNAVVFEATNSGTYVTPLSFTTANNAIRPNSWNHIAVVRSGNSFTIYVNGVSSATSTNSITIFNASNNTKIGSNTNNQHFLGYISGTRIVVGTAVYTGTFTVPTSPFTPTMSANPYGGSNTSSATASALLNYTNASIVDSTAKNVLETAGNAQISTTQSKFGGSSMYFDGTGDYLKGVYSPNMILSGDFTIECWINFSAHQSYGGIISFANSNTSVAPTSGWAFVFFSTTDRLYFEAGGGVGIQATNAVTANQWNHVAVVRSGSTITHYLNGVANGSGTSSAIFTPLTTDNFVIGSNRGFDASMTGYLDDIRITRGYARYTGNFTPQTSQWQDQ